MLGDESPLGPVTEAHGSNPLVHLSWNETGSELAAVDCSGRISIYSISIALNSITGLRQASFDSSDDSNQIVGMMWLNSQRSVSALQSCCNGGANGANVRSMHSTRRPKSTAAGLIRPFADGHWALFIQRTKAACSV